jgi:hypothetical protein
MILIPDQVMVVPLKAFQFNWVQFEISFLGSLTVLSGTSYRGETCVSMINTCRQVRYNQYQPV